jgi:hypothetical protein
MKTTMPAIPAIISHRVLVAGTHLTRIRRQFVVYSLLPRGKCAVKGGRMASPFGVFELALVLVRFNHVARFIVNATAIR